MKTDLKVGDSIYYVTQLKVASPRYLTINKIGNKWIYAGQEKFDENLIADGRKYSSPGRAYRSKEEYELMMQKKDKWTEVRLFFGKTYSPPEYLSVDDMNMILQIAKGNTYDSN